MNFRERIADWLTGGDLSDLIHDNERIIHDLCGRDRELIAKDAALASIVAMETPGANATVRRMARTAREALGE